MFYTNNQVKDEKEEDPSNHTSGDGTPLIMMGLLVKNTNSMPKGQNLKRRIALDPIITQ